MASEYRQLIDVVGIWCDRCDWHYSGRVDTVVYAGRAYLAGQAHAIDNTGHRIHFCVSLDMKPAASRRLRSRRELSKRA